jgi:hypothetical protein
MILAMIFLLLVLVLLHIWLFNIPLPILIMRLSSIQGIKHLIRTIFSIGFLKSSIRKCARHYILLFTLNKRARLHHKALDSNLITLDNTTITLSSIFDTYNSIPIIMSIGSYSWPPLVRNIDNIKDIYTTYSNKIKLITIYIEEAHASDDWSLPSQIINDMKKSHNYDGENITIAKTINDRIATANKFVNDFDYPCDVYCDDIRYIYFNIIILMISLTLIILVIMSWIFMTAGLIDYTLC